jgi:hypothetical protein
MAFPKVCQMVLELAGWLRMGLTGRLMSVPETKRASTKVSRLRGLA